MSDANFLFVIRFGLLLLSVIFFYGATRPVHPSQIELHGYSYKETDARLYTVALFLFGLAVIL